MRAVHIGCSGWNYRDWRGRFYPPGLPARDWLAHYARHFDTVEVNTTFYRLVERETAARWVRQTPPQFVFAVKGSRYLTHMKRLTDRDRGIARFFERIEPLVEAGRLGPVLWQLPERLHRDDGRLAGWLEALRAFPAARHCMEFRHASWFVPEIESILREHGAALVIADRPGLDLQAHALTADWTFVRFHHGTRGRRGNYSETELREWAQRIARWREDVEVFAYFNNDWEGFAVRNAARLLRMLAG